MNRVEEFEQQVAREQADFNDIMEMMITPKIKPRIVYTKFGFIRCQRPGCGAHRRPRVRSSGLLCRKCGATFPYITRAQVRAAFESGAIGVMTNVDFYNSDQVILKAHPDQDFWVGKE